MEVVEWSELGSSKGNESDSSSFEGWGTSDHHVVLTDLGALTPWSLDINVWLVSCAIDIGVSFECNTFVIASHDWWVSEFIDVLGGAVINLLLLGQFCLVIIVLNISFEICQNSCLFITSSAIFVQIFFNSIFPKCFNTVLSLDMLLKNLSISSLWKLNIFDRLPLLLKSIWSSGLWLYIPSLVSSDVVFHKLFIISVLLSLVDFFICLLSFILFNGCLFKLGVIITEGLWNSFFRAISEGHFWDISKSFGFLISKFLNSIEVLLGGLEGSLVFSSGFSGDTLTSVSNILRESLDGSVRVLGTVFVFVDLGLDSGQAASWLFSSLSGGEESSDNEVFHIFWFNL